MQRAYYTLKYKKAFPLSALIFLLLTLGYIFLEIYFNFTLIHQMSVESSEEKIDRLELFGKILSGLGIGLLITKGDIDKHRFSGEMIIGSFVLWSIVGIIISFILQTAIIKSVVYFGSDQDKAKSLLVTQLNNTVVPYFNKPENNPNADITAREYYKAAQECREQGKGAEVDGKLNKVVFAYQTLNEKFNEDSYRKTVEDYQKCLLTKTILEQAPKPLWDEKVKTKAEIKKELYEKYKEIDDTYQKKVAEFNEWKKNNRDPFGQVSRKMVKEIQDQWISSSKSLFGQDSVVSPNLSKAQFFKHNDIIKRINSIPSRESLDKDFEDRKKGIYNSALTDLFIPYNHHRQFIDEAREKRDYVVEKISEENAKLADEAYKSIVMPIVILFFSIFFLILNVLSIFTFFVNRIEVKLTERRIFTKLSQYMVYGVMAWLMLLPTISTKTPIENAGYFTNTVFFYEKILIDLKEKKDLKVIKDSLKSDTN